MTWIGMWSLVYRGNGRPETLQASRASGHIIARRCSGVVLPLRSSLGSAPRRNTRMGNEWRAAARFTRGEDTPNYTALFEPRRVELREPESITYLAPNQYCARSFSFSASKRLKNS